MACVVDKGCSVLIAMDGCCLPLAWSWRDGWLTRAWVQLDTVCHCNWVDNEAVAAAAAAVVVVAEDTCAVVDDAVGAVEAQIAVVGHRHCCFPAQDKRRLVLAWSDKSCLCKVSTKHVSVACCACSLSDSSLPFCFETKPVIGCVNILAALALDACFFYLYFSLCHVQFNGQILSDL